MFTVDNVFSFSDGKIVLYLKLVVVVANFDIFATASYFTDQIS